MKTIVKMKFGSHLYGTDTPNSDTDYKGVFMPSADQVLLGRIPKSINEQTKRGSETKNTADDVDTEIYSLHYFIHLACEGETVALDMLHAPSNMILEDSCTWRRIVDNRQKFYTRNLKAFIGYARRQAAKYGIKGSRLNDALRVVECLSNYGLKRICDIWDTLPEGEHIAKHPPNENNERMYEVCGRKVGERATIEYAHDIFKKFADAYGERAKQAARNEGIDWKAVSHTFRAAYQVKEILTEGKITFPLREADFLRNVKGGMYDYQTEIAPKLDSLMDEVEVLSAESTLPIKPDREFWDSFICNVVRKTL
jgi:hypothetical protein